MSSIGDPRHGGLAGRLAALAALALLAGPGLQVRAAEPAPGIDEEFVVVGERRAYRGDFTALETPQAVLVIDPVAMERAGVRDLDGALDLSASVARQNNFGGLWNSYAVRGFVGDENLPSGYLVNGFNAGRGFGGARDISGIERVEVLKGPTAALFGRGEPGGTVNLVTKRPTFEQAGELRVSGDSFDLYRVDVDVASAPIADRAAVRLVGHHAAGDSFRDTVSTRSYGISPSLAVRLSERTALIYELEATRQEVLFDRGVVAVDGRLGVIPESRFLGEPGDGDLEAEVLGHQLELRHDLDDDWSLLLGFGFRQTSLEGFSTEPELSGSRQRLALDGRTLTRQRRLRAYDADYLVLRAELGGSFELGGFEHRVLFGADIDEFENDQMFMRYRAPGLATDPSLEASYVIDILEPVYGQFPLPEVGPLTDRVETLQATGIYFQDQIRIGERLQVRIGARYDDFGQKLDNRLAGTRGRQSDGRLSPQLGAVWTVGPDWSLYAAYGEGFRANSGSDAAGRSFDPNESSSLEAGVKFEALSGALRGTVSAFRIEQENVLTADPANAGFSLAVGEARSRGVEVDLAGTVAGTDFMFSWAWIDAETTRDVLDPNFALQIESGSRLLNVPQQSLSLQLSREFRVADSPLALGGGLLYVGDRSGEVATDFELPDHALLRLFAAFDPTERITLRAEVDNLFDETWYANSFSQLWIQPGAPRRFRLSAALRF